MATDQGSGASAPRNPEVQSIEPSSVTVWACLDTGGVGLEVVDGEGRGFQTILDQDAALSLVLKVTGSLARLRGWGDQS